MKRLLILLAALAIGAAAADVRCSAVRPARATVVLACSASRLEAHR